MLLTLLGKCPISVILTEQGGTFVFLCMHVSAWEGCTWECWDSGGGGLEQEQVPTTNQLRPAPTSPNQLLLCNECITGFSRPPP